MGPPNWRSSDTPPDRPASTARARGGRGDNPRPAEAVVHDIEIADRRHDERRVDADGIGQHALQHRQDRAADNRHDQQAGTFARQRAELIDAQHEDGGEHYGVEQAHRNDAAHRNASRGGHRDPDQRGRDNGRAAQHFAGRYFAHHGRADEAAHHGPAPIEGNESRGGALRETADIRLREVVHQETADGNFRAHVHENTDGAKYEMPVLPDAVAGQDAVTLFDI